MTYSNGRFAASSDRFAAPTSYASDLLEAARDNPVSTALIGMGLMWMVMGDNTSSAFRKVRGLGATAASNLSAGGSKVVDSVSSLTASASETASAGFTKAADHSSEVGSLAKRQLDQGSSSAAAAGSDVAGSLRDGLDSATRAASDIASRTQATVSKMGSQAGDGAVDFIATLRDGFADLLDRQPLVLGALGLAVGAGVAAALPRIAAEDSMTGTFGNLKETVRDGVVGAYSRAADEARAQGLTLEAAADAVSKIGDKVSVTAKGTVKDATSSVS